jgi:hypothetical protein
MARLLLVDAVGGSLAALGAAMAGVEGAPGFDEVKARTTAELRVDPLIHGVLEEVGVRLVPPVKQLTQEEPDASTVIISLGDSPVPVPGAAAHWDVALAPADAPRLVQRSTARRMRDTLARQLAAFCASR